MDDRVKTIVNYHGTQTTNAEEIEFIVTSALDNPVIDFVERNYSRASLSIFTAPSSGGIPLAPGIDFTYTKENEYASNATDLTIYSGISITNTLYHNVPLYIPAGTLALFGDVTDEEDINRLQAQIDTSNGGFNLFNGNMNGGVRDYVAYDDGAVDAPVDGTGGSPTVTVTLETASPLIGDNSLLFTKPTIDCQGQGFAKDFTIDEGVRGKTTELKFTYKASEFYVAGDMGMYLYDIDNDVMLLPSVVDVPDSENAGDYFSTFITGDGANYRLIWHVQTTNTLPYTMIMDKVEVGEFSYNLGDGHETYDTGWIANSDWTATTLVVTTPFNFDSISDIDSKFYVSIDGTEDNSIEIVGMAIRDAGINEQTSLGYGKTGTNELTYYTGASGVRAPSLDGLGSSVLLGAASARYYKVVVTKTLKNINTASDFTEYASNSSTTDADDTTSFVYGVGGSEGIIGNTALSANRLKRVQFKNPIQPTDNIFLEIYDPTSNTWSHGTTRIGTYNVAFGTQIYINAVGGAFIQPYNEYELDVFFYPSPNGYSADDWNNIDLSGAKWRVRKVSNGNMAEVPRMVRAEYNNAVATSAGEPLQWSDVVEDTHNCVTTGADWRFTCVVPGVYSFRFGCNAVSATYLTVFKNGVQGNRIGSTQNNSGLFGFGQTTARMVIGDYIQFQPEQSSVSATTNVGITIERIGN